VSEERGSESEEDLVMPLTRAKKTEKVTALASELEHSTSAIIGTFAGLTASKDFDLRKTVRDAGGSYHVVKNKLAARAAKGTQIEAALQGLKGVSSVAYTSGDPVALAKALSTWVKDNAEFTFKLGIVDGKVITVQEITALATMPGKEELFSKLLFLIQSPAQRLATVINATGRDLAVVINQAAEKGKFGAPEATPAPVAEAPVAEAPVAAPVAEASAPEAAPESTEAAAHVEESAAGEQPSGAAQPENSTASQGGEAAEVDPVEGA
jgi:large subunit ribosomal protein L10